ncbi:MAG: DNA (cytosine-5-)-methyltransferase [Betaproteobacteria bacterium HGW-Betaproteobacteria-13]|nr:MAG: DNA (cytosine-5-)-methyltransferase [Betaproteobacteria bacterium HGW-Betaproteobacteria-13]
MRVAGLFAGIGGFEHGLASEGHHTELLCDVLPQSRAVLQAHFRDVEYEQDVRSLRDLPSAVDLITAGFPCQDLSQAGRTAGLQGARSGLIGEIFRLLRHRRVPTVVVENVPFMLQLGKGQAMRSIIDEFEALGYRWAYRTVDTFSFGLPQRRERVILAASREFDPAEIVLSDDNPLNRPATAIGEVAHGFYWTEGLGGLGWAVDAVPTLKNGSTIGIPSPPAIFMPDGRIVKPSIQDAEALQGFPRGWTEPAETVARASSRWALVGSAVSVPVAQWLGRRLHEPKPYDRSRDEEFPLSDRCPRAARCDGRKRYAVSISTDPIGVRPQSLAQFVQGPLDPLSLKAATGFLGRTRRARLRFEDAFIRALEDHITNLGGAIPPRLAA